MEGRHVGLDFYDLLIEALMGQRPRPPGKAQHSLPTTQSKRSVFRLLSSQTERRRRQR